MPDRAVRPADADFFSKWIGATRYLLFTDYGINNNFDPCTHFQVERLDRVLGWMADVETPLEGQNQYMFAYQQVRFEYHFDDIHWNWYDGYLSRRHNGATNVLFTDFHVESRPWRHWVRNDAVFAR